MIPALQADVSGAPLLRSRSTAFLAMVGTILPAGNLGGAAATHVRIAGPLFSHGRFGVYIGLLAWGGLWLRDPRVRALLPLRR